MKKLLLFAIALISSITINAQSTEHLTFRDIPIDGDILEFVEQMKTKSFTEVKPLNNGYEMAGRFVNKDCEVYIFCSPNTRVTSKVVLYAPKDNSWASLKSDYLDFKAQLTQKYGKPTKTFEFFSSPYYEGDNYELQALKNEKCHYLSYWETSLGVVALSLSEFCQLKFVYEDAININKAGAEKSQNIQNEL